MFRSYFYGTDFPAPTSEQIVYLGCGYHPDAHLLRAGLAHPVCAAVTFLANAVLRYAQYVVDCVRA